MTSASHACPHCGSRNHRLLADHLGRVGWCGDCHRTWEAPPVRAATTLPLRRDSQPQRERRSA